jgi:hypothetical protein
MPQPCHVVTPDHSARTLRELRCYPADDRTLWTANPEQSTLRYSAGTCPRHAQPALRPGACRQTRTGRNHVHDGVAGSIGMRAKARRRKRRESPGGRPKVGAFADEYAAALLPSERVGGKP